MNESVRICGLGTRVPEETTLEALIALGECREAFCAVEDPRSFRWLKARVPGLKKAPGAAAIVAAAKKKGGPVGLAVWGHPQFTSRLAREVERGLRAGGLEYKVYGAISPVGSAFARSVSFLGGDYGYQGLQCYDLDTCLGDPEAATDRLPLIVCSEKSTPARWSELFALLRSRYPAAHEVRIYPVGSDEERVVAVGKLSAKALSGAIVLIPPKGGAPKRPHDMAA